MFKHVSLVESALKRIPVLQNLISSSLELKWQVAVCLTKENLCWCQGHSVFGWLSLPFGSAVFNPSACCWRSEAAGKEDSRCGDRLMGETGWLVVERQPRHCQYTRLKEFVANDLQTTGGTAFLPQPTWGVFLQPSGVHKRIFLQWCNTWYALLLDADGKFWLFEAFPFINPGFQNKVSLLKPKNNASQAAKSWWNMKKAFPKISILEYFSLLVKGHVVHCEAFAGLRPPVLCHSPPLLRFPPPRWQSCWR